ncbi:hypothetical protein OMP38_14370 [Cohnella ginsengisoli]|uniref:Uncharacterized protein n=1 Tax=Cohnella ginsengisoli TaxID=425004 RepID=A0A9X4QMZ0_9BACL|nr:hypothetical protein [Cohnella ginsengisoli]MDG0791901.1 hypothetical protein [Cohnella ginsengisoli]
MRQLLVFVLFATLFCWLMFSPVYKHVVVLRQSLLQQEVDYLLEVGASGRYGYIDAAMIVESRTRLSGYGFRPEILEYEVTTASGMPGTDSAAPLQRGDGLRLVIRYPYDGLMDIDRLIGVDPPSSMARMAAAGMKMSEYVP